MTDKTEIITKQDDPEVKADDLAEVDDKITLSEVEDDEEVVEEKPADDAEGFDIVKTEPEGEAAEKPDLKSEHVDKLIAKARHKGEAKLTEAKEENAGVTQELTLANEELTLLRLALKNKTEESNDPAALVKPNHEEFAEGRDDKRYLAEMEAFDNDKIQRVVSAQVKKLTEGQEKTAPAPQTNGQVDPAVTKRQRAHFERVVDLEVEDYDASEQVVADMFGADVLSRFIDSYDNSHMMVYYLGKEKNQAEAKELAGMLKGDERGGILALGALGILNRDLKRVPRSGKPTGKQPGNASVEEDDNSAGPPSATFE